MLKATDLSTYASYQKYNFFRAPDWRWERVLAIADRPGKRPGRCSRRDDQQVRAAKSFFSRRTHADAAGLDRLLHEDPGLFYAYEFNLRTQDDPEAAMYLQARLLARQTPAEVAAVMGVLPETVTWYADLFFDVVPYLEQRDWITKQVLLPALVRSKFDKFPDTDLPATNHRDIAIVQPFMDGTLKLFAYFGGSQLVDVMIGGMQAGKQLSAADEIDGWLDRSMSTTLRRRAAQASQIFEINKYNVMELFAVNTKLMEIANSSDNQDQSRSVIERHIKSTIDDIPWTTGNDTTEGVVGKFDKMSGELRDDELLLLASGREAPTVSADNFPKQLPPPRKTRQTVLTRDESI